MERKPNNVNKFWLSYHDALIASGIPEKTAERYVHWAQKFAVSMNYPAASHWVSEVRTQKTEDRVFF